MDQIKNLDIYKYVYAHDGAYNWKTINITIINGITMHTIELVSQKWLKETDTDSHVWKHMLAIYVPSNPRDTCFLRIRCGTRDRLPKPDKHLLEMAIETNSIMACVYMIPNQPIIFNFGDTEPKHGDSAVAYTWELYLRYGNPELSILFPMVKSVVKVMDTITEIFKLDKYVIMGASKRGLTAWLTALLDSRVVAIVPLVFDTLNLSKTLQHQTIVYQKYGEAMNPYGNVLGKQHFEAMSKLDPYTYKNYLTIPKFIINSTGDEFFLPDSSRFYYDDLVGEKYLCYMPNTNHNICKFAFKTILPFYKSIINHSELPKCKWEYIDDDVIVYATATPKIINVWHANNPKERDFRLEIVGAIWKNISIEPNENNIYKTTSQNLPGYNAFFVELIYDNDFSLTTSVYIVEN